MKLIMKTEYDALRLNPLLDVYVDKNGDKEVVRIEYQGNLIAKRKKYKRRIQYFGVPSYQEYL